MKLSHYYELPGLEHVYLEDSYVLNIETLETRVKFLLDTVLTKEHPAYRTPPPEEQYCYKKACLEFNQVDKVKWINKVMIPYSDASGEIDYGNIDTLSCSHGNYHLSGDWGEIEIISSPPTIEFLANDKNESK